MSISTRCAVLFLISIAPLTGCVSNAPSSVKPLAAPDDGTIQRLHVDQSNRRNSAVALIAQPEGENTSTSANSKKVLLLDDLLRSVEKQFPLILAAIETVEIANAEFQSAEGSFDLRLKSRGEFNGTGFYENEMGGVMLEQPTAAYGATFFGGYKIGSGNFAVWDGGLQTNEGGEFSAGVRLPLLAGRSIDSRRLALWQARITQSQAEPLILQKRVETTRKAAGSYWKWVAAGQKLNIAKHLLSLAVDRKDTVELSVKEGELPSIALVENRRLVVERESIIVRTERTLQQSSIALSLFWRTKEGVPRIPGPRQLPKNLPTPRNPSHFIRENDVALALERHPKVYVMELNLKKLELEIQKAKNDTLPRLDLAAEGSQDTGNAVSNPDNKGPFEAGVYVQLDVPLQRRTARGKVRSLSAKRVQLERTLQLSRDFVTAEVQDAESALRQTWLRLAQVKENVELAGEIEEAERLQLGEGESDLFRVNLREQQTASAASIQVDVITEHFQALADYRASLSIPYDDVIR